MSKRRRGSFRRQTKRPIDKQIITINRIGGPNEVDLLMIVQAGARTLTGLRWALSFTSNSQQSQPMYWWAIVVVKDGDTPNDIDIGELASLYQPEQHVMAWGTGRLIELNNAAGPKIIKDEGHTKVMRKMMDGDQLVLLTTTNVAAGTLVNGAVQFFLLF